MVEEKCDIATKSDLFSFSHSGTYANEKAKIV